MTRGGDRQAGRHARTGVARAASRSIVTTAAAATARASKFLHDIALCMYACVYACVRACGRGPMVADRRLRARACLVGMYTRMWVGDKGVEGEVSA